MKVVFCCLLNSIFFFLLTIFMILRICYIYTNDDNLLLSIPKEPKIARRLKTSKCVPICQNLGYVFPIIQNPLNRVRVNFPPSTNLTLTPTQLKLTRHYVQTCRAGRLCNRSSLSKQGRGLPVIRPKKKKRSVSRTRAHKYVAAI